MILVYRLGKRWWRLPAAGLAALMLVAAVPVEAPADPLGPARIYDAKHILAGAEFASSTAPVASVEDRRSPQKAMLLSLLLPGLGEHWLGHRNRAYFFFGLEAATWTTYTVFKVQGSHAKDRYQEWADLLAGVAPRSDDDFYRTVGNYVASDGPFSANEQIRREARALYPNDRVAQEQYLQENGYFGEDAWRWDSFSALDEYRSLRSESLDAYNRADLTLAVFIATRLISAVDAVILANKHNRTLEDDDGASLRWQIDAGFQGAHAGLVMSRKF